tara:strand:+ start:1234 stop:1413 length:180 start_codon:yes stop_codon:yes gene_type:complete
MILNMATLRVKELAQALSVDSPEIIAVCTILQIPASSPLTSLSVDQCKRIITYIHKENH